MSRPVATWGLGLVVSVATNIGFGAALLAGLQPQDIPDQPTPESTLDVIPEVVERSAATQQEPDSTDVSGGQTDGADLDAGAVTTSRARPQNVPQSQAVEPDTTTQPAPAQQPQTTVATGTLTATTTQPQNAISQTTPPRDAETQPSAAIAPQPADLAAQSATTEQAAVLTPSANLQNARAPQAPMAIIATLDATLAKPVAPQARPTQAATLPLTAAFPSAPVSTERTAAAAVQAAPQPPIAIAAAVTPRRAPDAILTPPSAAPTNDLPDQVPTPVALPSSAPETTATKAVLAFPDAGGGDIDPASLAAFQSFTQPDADNADPLRDNLQALLSLPCARMQVSFDPVTTTLRVDGHVPDADQRGPILTALQAQMGGNIAVTDNLLVLPAPQCGALSGIASVGLPQSTDQITNPLIVGADTHARSFRYIKDDPLVLELTGPDYPAYIYVDYFDADGNVIHLSPNAQAPLTATQPKEQIVIGARKPSDPGLMVIVGPPYGQEIAVAFAASTPLYTDERPLVEPAAPYLSWLQNQVTRARKETPDFKGEWVYFFMQTTAE